MELKRIEIRNFLGIGDGAVDFNRPSGITLIKGENDDSPSSISNGAGKSSIFEALYWVLYGKTKRGVTGDGVINTAANKDCQVALWFDDFKLVRGRKPKLLTLHQDDGTGMFSINLTKSTEKETQELFENIIKISELTFSKVAYFGQEDVKAFASLTDAELKRVFEQALGLTFLTDHMEKAKSHLAKIKADLLINQQDMSKFDFEIGECRERIGILQKAVKDLESRSETEKLRILADIGADRAALEDIKRQYNETLVKSAEARSAVGDMKTKLDELTGYRDKLVAEQRNKISDGGKVEFEQRANTNELTKMKMKLSEAPRLVGVPCGECKRPFTEADIENVINGLQDSIKEREAAIKGREAESKAIKAKVGEIEAVMERLDQAIASKRDEMSSKLATSNVTFIDNEISKQVKSAQELVRRIEANEYVLVKLNNEAADYTLEISNAKSKIEDREMEKGILKRRLDVLQADFDIAEMLVEVLGNAGMKSYIFDNVTPALNTEINKFARILDDIAVEVSTVTALKSGEFRERFHIKVENEHGAGEYDGNSGGEKQKVNLAVALGFNKVFRAMSEGAVNAVFLDEPFEALDKGSSEAVIELCRAFTGVENVFIITHQDAIKDLITDTITVKKKGKKAVIC